MRPKSDSAGDRARARPRGLLGLGGGLVAGATAGWLLAVRSSVEPATSLMGVAYLLAFIAGVASFWAP